MSPPSDSGSRVSGAQGAAVGSRRLAVSTESGSGPRTAGPSPFIHLDDLEGGAGVGENPSEFW